MLPVGLFMSETLHLHLVVMLGELLIVNGVVLKFVFTLAQTSITAQRARTGPTILRMQSPTPLEHSLALALGIGASKSVIINRLSTMVGIAVMRAVGTTCGERLLPT